MDDDAIQSLVAAAKAGSDLAWQELFRACHDRLLSTAQRLLGKNWAFLSPRDLVQETWLRARLSLDRYRGEGFFGWA